MSYVYVWRYEVPAGSRARFERTYGPDGDWVRLFRQADGYRSTRLLREEGAPGRYLTVDEWDSRAAFDAFRARRAGAFEALDERCASLTSAEELVGHFESDKKEPFTLRSGRLHRFLRYALGEVVIVTIGILIALQINAWNGARVDRGRERGYVASMQGDLQGDIAQIDETVAGNRVMLDGLDSLLRQLANPRPDAAYRRHLYLTSLVRTYWYLVADFPELTLTQLEHSDGLRLIRDDSVKLAMLGYRQAVGASHYQYEELARYFHVFEATQKGLFDYRIGKRAFEYIEADTKHMLEPLEAFEPLVPEGTYLSSDDPELLGRYYGDILFYRTALNNTVLALRAQRSAAESLLELIGRRYP